MEDQINGLKERTRDVKRRNLNYTFFVYAATKRGKQKIKNKN